MFKCVYYVTYTSSGSHSIEISSCYLYLRDNNTLLFTSATGSLEDVHLLELSKRITNAQDLEDLGIKALKLPGFKIKTALYDHSDSIQAAAHDVISYWVKQQPNRQVAYITMIERLKEVQMHQLATEVQQWVEGTIEKPAVTLNKGMCF